MASAVGGDGYAVYRCGWSAPTSVFYVVGV